MPGIDVTELLTDPTFAERFTVIRATKVVAFGRTKLGVERFPGITGVVQPAGGIDLQRLPEGSNLSGAIVIWTKYILTNGELSEDLTADQIEWNGHLYTVMNVKDWSQYGAGFINAVCQLATNKARTDGV